MNTQRKIKPAGVIRGIAVLLFAAVLTMTAGIANAEPTATRTLPAEPVAAGGSFLVEIAVSDYGTSGNVLETLPEGFTYVTSTLDPKSVMFYGQTNTVKFYLIGETSFTYTVALGYYKIDEGTHTFHGILQDGDKNEYVVGGDTEMEVEGGDEDEDEDEDAEPTATRTLPEEPVPAGERFTVKIEAPHYGIHGYVVETLPKGFMYEDSTLNPDRVDVEDDTVKFELGGEPSFTYTVTASDAEGTYTFSGILIDEDKNEYDISGDTEIEVGEGRGEAPRAAPNITSWKPVEAAVSNAEGESRTFNSSVNQTVTISWQINGTEMQTNERVTEAAYTNRSAVIGTWNVTAIATNTTTGLSDTHTWIWSVTPLVTPTVHITVTPSPTAPSASVTPVQTHRPSPPAATPTPASPGFGAVFAVAATFAVTYSLLQRKKGNAR